MKVFKFTICILSSLFVIGYYFVQTKEHQTYSPLLFGFVLLIPLNYTLIKFFKKREPIEPETERLLKAIGITICIIAIGYLVLGLLIISSWTGWLTSTHST